MAEPGRFLEYFKDEEKETLAGLRLAVVVALFYDELAERLIKGAEKGFELAGVPNDNVTYDAVPGAYELPFAAKVYAETETYDGVACLGVVIRGETDHYDFVCAEAARGLQQVQLETNVPCAFGVITCDCMDQALARSGGDKRDQGRNAALTVVQMALLQRRVG